MEYTIVDISSITAYSGIVRLTRKDLEKLVAERKKVAVRVMGALVIGGDVSPALASQAIASVHVRGPVCAPAGVKAVLQRLKK